MTERGLDTRDRTTLPRPQDAAREGQLNIARAMRSAGRVHQALQVLSYLLDSSPQDAQSRAVAEEMISLAHDCQQRGQYYTALHLYRQLEQLA